MKLFVALATIAASVQAADTDYCKSTRPFYVASNNALECSNSAGPQFSCPEGFYCDTTQAAKTTVSGAQGFCCTLQNPSVCQGKTTCATCAAEGCSWVQSQCVPFCIPQTFAGTCITEVGKCPTGTNLPQDEGTCWRRCGSVGWIRQPYTQGTRPVYVYPEYPSTTSSLIPTPPGQYFPALPNNYPGYPLNGYPVPPPTYTYIGLPAEASKCSCDTACTTSQDCCYDHTFYCV